MSIRESSLGQTATFLLPSLKLKQPSTAGDAIEPKIHDFLVQSFGGYTATQGNLFGFWSDEDGSVSYGEHRAFTVACTGPDKQAMLKDFLARTSRELDEKCIYLELGGTATLIYADEA